MDDDMVPDLVAPSDSSDDEEAPGLKSSSDSASDSEGLPALLEERRLSVGDGGAVEAQVGATGIAALDRQSAPYSQPVGMKEEGPTALRRKHVHSAVASPAGASAQVEQLQASKPEPTSTTNQFDVSEQPAARMPESQPETTTPVVPQDAFAKFQEKELENLKRLRKERGLADSESMSQMVVARCHLRPGAPGSKLCEHDPSFFSLRCAERRIVVECTKGCRMLYHFPNCWRRVIKAYKEDVDPSWIGWSKGKEPQLVPCITDQCGGYIASAVVVEGAAGEEEVRETQYQLPKELTDQLERQRQQDAAQAAQVKIELLQKQQEESRAQRRRRKAEAAAAKRAAKQAQVAGAAVNGHAATAPAAGTAAKGRDAGAKAAPQPAIKIYNKGAATVASNATAKATTAADSPWTPPVQPAAPAVAPPPAAEASDPEFPALSTAAQAGSKPKAPAPKKKVKMVPLDPRALGFAAADDAAANKFDDYYEEVDNSEDYAYDRELQELDRKYPHFERDDYGNPLYPDDLYMGLDRLRLDPEMPAVTNHLLVEYLDIAKLVQVTNLNVDTFLREKFSAWGGHIMHFRIFTRQEAAAISFYTADQAAVAWVRMEGKKLYRNYLNISFLHDFPNDIALKRVVPSYQPRNQRNMRPEKSTCFVKYLPTDMLREMADVEEQLSTSEVVAVLRHYEFHKVDDASEHGIPPPDARTLRALTTFRPFSAAARQQQPQQQQLAVEPAPAEKAALAARQGSPQGQGQQGQAQRRSTLDSQASSGSEAAAPQAEASEANGSEAGAAEGGERAAGGAGAAAAEAARQPQQAPAQAAPPASAATPGFELMFDVVQVLGCKSDHLQNHYRRYSAFKLEHRFFCEPQRIGAGPQERTALVLCNIDTGRLEGLWQATTNNGREVDFKPVATVPALPFETYAPLLPPDMLHQAAANTPLKIPARLSGQHARQVLASFSRAAAAAGMGALTPRAAPTASPAAPPAAPQAPAALPAVRAVPPAAAAPAAAASTSQPPASAAAPAAAAPRTTATAAAPAPHTIAAAAAAAAAKRPAPLQPIASPPAASPATTPTPPHISPMASPSAPQSTPPPTQVFPLLPTIPVSAAAAAPAAHRAYPIIQAPAPAAPTTAPAPTAAPARTVPHVFPFFMGGGAAGRPPVATGGPPRPTVIQPLTVVTPAARPLATVAPLTTLSTYAPTGRPAALAPLPYATLPYLQPAGAPAPPAPAPPAPPATSPSPTPFPAASPSPAPPSATPSPVPAAGPPKRVRNPCALCGARKALYLHVQCVKFGPCAECLPDKSQLASVYPTCLHCHKPTCDADIVKVHR